MWSWFTSNRLHTTRPQNNLYFLLQDVGYKSSKSGSLTCPWRIMSSRVNSLNTHLVVITFSLLSIIASNCSCSTNSAPRWRDRKGYLVAFDRMQENSANRLPCPPFITCMYDFHFSNGAYVEACNFTSSAILHSALAHCTPLNQLSMVAIWEAYAHFQHMLHNFTPKSHFQSVWL